MSRRPESRLFRLVFSFCAQYWRNQPLLIGAMIVLTLATTTIEAITPLLIGNLIDALTAGRRSDVIRSASLFLMAGFGCTLLRYANLAALIRSTAGTMIAIAEQGFRRVQHFSTEWHNTTLSGSTVRSISRGMWSYDTLADSIILGVIPTAMLIVTVAGLMMWRWQVIGISLATGVVFYMLMLARLTQSYVLPATRSSNRVDTDFAGCMADSITCNSVVKSFASERQEEARLGRVARYWHALMTITWVRNINLNLFQNLVVTVLQVVILSLGLHFWTTGKASAGDIAYLLTSLYLLSSYLREFSVHYRSLLRSVGELEATAKLSSALPDVVDDSHAHPLRPGPGTVSFEQVVFRYPKSPTPLYEHLSVSIAAGSRIGLVGPSGSGKSTFVKLIQRLYDLEGGTIRIDGQDISKTTQASLRCAISLVQQEPILFHRTLFENIAYAKVGACRREVIDAAKRAHAHEFISSLPYGYDTIVGERGIRLSGGERQRVALARAILPDSQILILDEATSSLDSISEYKLQQAIYEASKGRTTIIIAHRLSTVQSADRILLFEQGRIVEDGNHFQLLDKPDGHYRRLFETQVLGLVNDVDSIRQLEKSLSTPL